METRLGKHVDMKLSQHLPVAFRRIFSRQSLTGYSIVSYSLLLMPWQGQRPMLASHT
jgi:hypothetical protein